MRLHNLGRCWFSSIPRVQPPASPLRTGSACLGYHWASQGRHLSDLNGCSLSTTPGCCVSGRSGLCALALTAAGAAVRVSRQQLPASPFRAGADCLECFSSFPGPPAFRFERPFSHTTIRLQAYWGKGRSACPGSDRRRRSRSGPTSTVWTRTSRIWTWWSPAFSLPTAPSTAVPPPAPAPAPAHAPAPAPAPPSSRFICSRACSHAHVGVHVRRPCSRAAAVFALHQCAHCIDHDHHPFERTCSLHSSSHPIWSPTPTPGMNRQR